MAYAIMVQGKAHLAHVENVKHALMTLARESLKQPGTIRYDFYQPSDDVTTFILLAEWEDEAGWRANVASAEHDAYIQSLAPDAWEIRQQRTHLVLLQATI